MKLRLELFSSVCIVSSAILSQPNLLYAQKQMGNEHTFTTVDSISHIHALDSLLQWRASDTLPDERFIGFREFLAAVVANNLDYAVQKYNVSIAEAQVTIAKLCPDPSPSIGYTKDISNVPASQKFGDVWSVGASETILLGGKVGARSGVAEQNESLAEAQTEDFFRNLCAAAAQAYIASVIADSTYEADVRSYENLAELARINERRVDAGDLGKVDLTQSRVDAIQARGAVLQADAARRQAFIQLGQLMGSRSLDTLYRPAGNLSFTVRSFDLDTLIDRAKASRTDIIAARRALESARLSVNLANAERWPDVTVGAAYTYTGPSANQVAPFPSEKTLSLTLSIPLPLSDVVNQGTLQIAEFTCQQAQESLSAAELKAGTEVRQAYAQYQLAREQYEQYSSQLLADAKNVRDARLYSYKAGSASLLDVLAAENTLANVYLAYYSALSSYANAVIALEQAAGIWDIEF
jgi:cobalt-zinc-cadmium efflux system outer membrane protein